MNNNKVENADIRMMASIIDFIKNGPDSDNMVISNPAIGVEIVILKDWDFFDVMVRSEDGEHKCDACFCTDIEDFTEVFDFIWGSIDNILVTA